jgi:hypothetical protein
MNYYEEVWARAVTDAEAEVLRLTPTLCGGRKADETVEQYAKRAASHQERALWRLELARAALVAAADKPTKASRRKGKGGE